MPKVTDPSLLQQLGTPGHSRGMLVPDPFKAHAETRADASLGISAGSLAVQQANSNRDARRQDTLLAPEAEKAQADAIVAKQKASAGRFDDVTVLRKELDDLPAVKTYKNALPSYASALRSPDTPAGDLDLTYAFSKIMDPNSVVREGEQDTVAGIGTYAQQIEGKLRKQMNSQGMFPPETRAQLRQTLRGRVADYNRSYIAERARFADLAKRQGIDPALVVGPHIGDAYAKIENQYFNGDPNNAGRKALGPLATGDTRTENDPKASALIDTMIRQGSSDDQINGALKAIGFNQTVDPKQTGQAREYLKANPGYRGSFGSATREVPNSVTAQVTGSPLGVGIGAAMDAALGGTVDEIGAGLSGRPLADVNAEKQAAFAANPKAAFAGQMVGSGSAMWGLGALGAPGLATDLAFGAVSGAGQDNDNRLGGAALGTVGAGVGNGAGWLLSKPIGALARTKPGLAVVNGAREIASKLPGVTPQDQIIAALQPTQAEQAVVSGVRKAGKDDVASLLAKGKARGMPMTLADTAPSLGNLAGAAARRSDEARNLAENVLIPRSRDQITRMSGAVERELGPVGNVPQISDDLMQQARTAAGPLYDAAYAAPGASSVKLDDLVNRPLSMRPGLARARSIAAEEGRDPTSLGFDLDDQGEVVLTRVPSFQTLDYVKRGLDDILEPHRNEMTGKLALNEATRAINNTKNELLSRTDAVNPAYKAARDAYAGPVSAKDALARGQDAYSLSPDELKYQADWQTPEHLDQMQLGYRSALMQNANDLRYSTNPWSVLDSPSAEARLTNMYPGSDGPQNLFAARDMEKRMAGTATRVIGGSQTAERHLADEAFMPGPGVSALIDAGTAAAGGVPVASVTRLLATSKVADALRLGIGARAEQKAADIAPLLLDTSPANNLAVVDALMSKDDAFNAFVDKTTPEWLLRRLGASAGSNEGSAFGR